MSFVEPAIPLPPVLLPQPTMPLLPIPSPSPGIPATLDEEECSGNCDSIPIAIASEAVVLCCIGEGLFCWNVLCMSALASLAVASLAATVAPAIDMPELAIEPDPGPRPPLAWDKFVLVTQPPELASLLQSMWLAELVLAAAEMEVFLVTETRPLVGPFREEVDPIMSPQLLLALPPCSLYGLFDIWTGDPCNCSCWSSRPPLLSFPPSKQTQVQATQEKLRDKLNSHRNGRRCRDTLKELN